MKTTNDILREMREGMPQKMEGFCNGELVVLDTAKLADRIEAAHKREVADALDTGAFVAEAHKQTVTDCNGLNGAKMREAIEAALENLESSGVDERTYDSLNEHFVSDEDCPLVKLHKQLKSALAEGGAE